jgi:signal transduction histidine kinase
MVVTVTDDGPGIAPADLPHVFERLYQAKEQPVRAESGSGLGLAIVRELVAAMGGEVGVTSPPTGGTTFWFRIPTFGSATTATVV